MRRMPKKRPCLAQTLRCFSALRVRARISWHFGASAGRADARRRGAGDVVTSSRSGNAADARPPPRPAGLRIPGPPNYRSWLIMIPLGLGPAAKCQIILARALSLEEAEGNSPGREAGGKVQTHLSSAEGAAQCRFERFTNQASGFAGGGGRSKLGTLSERFVIWRALRANSRLTTAFLSPCRRGAGIAIARPQCRTRPGSGRKPAPWLPVGLPLRAAAERRARPRRP